MKSYIFTALFLAAANIASAANPYLVCSSSDIACKQTQSNKCQQEVNACWQKPYSEAVQKECLELSNNCSEIWTYTGAPISNDKPSTSTGKTLPPKSTTLPPKSTTLPPKSTSTGKTLPPKSTTLPSKSTTLPPKSTSTGKTLPPKTTSTGKTLPPTTSTGKTLPPTTSTGKTLPPTTSTGKTLPPKTSTGKTLPPKTTTTLPPKTTVKTTKTIPGKTTKTIPGKTTKTIPGGSTKTIPNQQPTEKPASNCEANDWQCKTKASDACYARANECWSKPYYENQSKDCNALQQECANIWN